jgi:hypothetical protein
MTLSNNEDVGLHLQPLVIPSDAFDPGEIDFSDPIAVKCALEQTTAGCLFTDEAIASMCAQDLARTLFFNGPMDENHPHVVALRDWVEPTYDHLSEVEDKQLLALLICDGIMYGTTKECQELIKSVEDEGIFGALAQAKLQPPMAIRTKRPSWYRPFKPSSFRGQTPNLFEAFGEEWKVSNSAEQAHATNTSVNKQPIGK